MSEIEETVLRVSFFGFLWKRRRAQSRTMNNFLEKERTEGKNRLFLYWTSFEKITTWLAVLVQRWVANTRFSFKENALAFFSGTKWLAFSCRFRSIKSHRARRNKQSSSTSPQVLKMVKGSIRGSYRDYNWLPNVDEKTLASGELEWMNLPKMRTCTFAFSPTEIPRSNPRSISEQGADLTSIPHDQWPFSWKLWILRLCPIDQNASYNRSDFVFIHF